MIIIVVVIYICLFFFFAYIYIAIISIISSDIIIINSFYDPLVGVEPPLQPVRMPATHGEGVKLWPSGFSSEEMVRGDLWMVYTNLKAPRCLLEDFISRVCLIVC
jgi:hypothetical protein